MFLLLTCAPAAIPFFPVCSAAYVLHRHGIDASRVIGRTPGLSDASRLSTSAADDANYADRAAEIRAWLHAHPSVTQCVALTITAILVFATPPAAA